MRFRYPVFYAILFGITIVVLGFLIGFYLLAEPKYILAFGLTIGLLIASTQFYEVTQSLWIDEQGIRFTSIFGEIRRFSWNEIVKIQSMGILNPGIKISNKSNETIKISAMLERYDLIIEWINQYSNGTWEKSQAMDDFKNRPLATPASSTNFEFKASTRKWISVPLILGFAIFLFIISLHVEVTLYKIFPVILILVTVPGYLHSFLREPIYIATKNDVLHIHFRSNTLRQPMQVEAQFVNAIYLRHIMNGDYPQTVLDIYLPGNVKLGISNFSTSNEEMYMKLSAWLKKYTPSSD